MQSCGHQQQVLASGAKLEGYSGFGGKLGAGKQRGWHFVRDEGVHFLPGILLLPDNSQA